MPPLAYFFAGFITGGVVMGVLTPLLFMWRADDAPSVRSQIDENTTSGTPGGGGEWLE